MLKYNACITRDPNFLDFTPDFGQYESILGIKMCNDLQRVVFSVEGINRLIGAVIAAPTKTPVPALEQLLEHSIGEAAFEDSAKKATGRMVRQAIEKVGGTWVRSGAKAPATSRYNRGSVYSLD